MTTPPSTADLNEALQRVRQRAAEIVKVDEVERWLDASIPALDGLSPRAAIRTGRLADVEQLLARVEVAGAS